MFIELGRAHRLEGGYFEVIIWMGCHIRMGPFLWGKLTLKTPCKDFDLVIGRGLGWMK